MTAICQLERSREQWLLPIPIHRLLIAFLFLTSHISYITSYAASPVPLSANAGKQMSGYEINMEMAKQLAASDPKIVANVIKTWVSNE